MIIVRNKFEEHGFSLANPTGDFNDVVQSLAFLSDIFFSGMNFREILINEKVFFYDNTTGIWYLTKPAIVKFKGLISVSTGLVNNFTLCAFNKVYDKRKLAPYEIFSTSGSTQIYSFDKEFILKTNDTLGITFQSSDNVLINGSFTLNFSMECTVKPLDYESEFFFRFEQ